MCSFENLRVVMWNFDKYEEKTAIQDDEGRYVTYTGLQKLLEEFSRLIL